MATINPGFNVRVYGLLSSADKSSILLVQEVIMGRTLLKFPGGGIEHQEGPADALVREFREELGVEIDVGPLFYVSPRFHLSVFRPQQLIGLYWKVALQSGEPRALLDHIRLVWQPLKAFNVSALTHPLDREVATLFLANCGN